MSEKEVKKCPKCSGEMERAESLYTSLFLVDSKAVVLETKQSRFFGKKVIPFYCKDCGYMELYKELKEKEG